MLLSVEGPEGAGSRRPIRGSSGNGVNGDVTALSERFQRLWLQA